MRVSGPRRSARLSIPAGLIVGGLTLRFADVLVGWSTVLILGGTIGGVLVAYVILLGNHELPMVTDQATEVLKISPGSSQDLLFPNRHERGYDGR